jgi:hypothetical protein
VAQNGVCRWPVSSAWRLYFLRRLLWSRTASAHRWGVLRQSHSSTASGGVALVSGSHRAVRWFRNTAQQLPRLVLLSSVRGIWCGLGGSSVRGTVDPHRPTLSHTHYAYKACCAPTHTRTQHVRRTHTTCACRMHTRAQRTKNASPKKNASPSATGLEGWGAHTVDAVPSK